MRDEPYEFTVGARQAIAAFDEAVTGMQPGGIRRVEIRGEIPELSYPRDRSQRFTNEPAPGETSAGLFKYRYEPAVCGRLHPAANPAAQLESCCYVSPQRWGKPQPAETPAAYLP